MYMNPAERRRPIPRAREMCAMRLSSSTIQGARDALPAYCGDAPAGPAQPPARVPASLLGQAPSGAPAPPAPPPTSNLPANNNSATARPEPTAVPNELITAINMYCRFCGEVSLSPEDLPHSFVKLLLVFQKNINVRSAYAARFPNHDDGHSFIDWERVALLGKDRAYLDTTSWIRVLASYTVVDISDTDLRALLRDQPVLHHYHECMLEARLVGAAAPDRATHLVYLYLLVNVQKLQSLHAVEQFYSINHNADRRAEALLFFSKLANRQFDRELQTQTLVTLLTRFVKVRSDWIRQELELLQMREQELEGLFRQKSIRAMSGRPRLRSRLKAITAASGSLFTMDQLSQWNGMIRFPNVFSMKQRKRLYFLMSQVHMDPEACIHLVLKDRDLAVSVLRYPVKQPEIEVLHECITGCRITSDPFPELHQFRASCFDGFAYEHKVRLRLNDLLHLFISAYQNQSVWKNLWKLVFPVLSIQIIRDVEAFVWRVPFPARAVLGTMFEMHDPPPSIPASPSSFSSPFMSGMPSRSASPLFPPPPTSRPGTAPPTSPPRALSPLPELGALSPLSPSSPTTPHGAARPQAHGVLGELHDAEDLVGDDETPGGHRVAKGVGEAAPLEHDGAAEPPGLELGVALGGRDPPHGDAAQPHHVEDEQPRQPGLDEELAAEDARRRALVRDDA